MHKRVHGMASHQARILQSGTTSASGEAEWSEGAQPCSGGDKRKWGLG